MKKLKTGFLLSIIGCLMIFSTMLSACGTEKVTLSTTDDITKLKPGESVQLLIDGVLPEGFTFRINEGSNYAEIDEDGVLTININAEPGEKVKVSAQKEGVKSNEITVTVDSINLTSLVASAQTTEVMRNNFYTLSYVATPANTTEKISWKIVDGVDYADIAGNSLQIKSNAPYNEVIKVKAEGETLTSNELVFTVVEYSSEGLHLRGQDEVEKLDAAQSNHVYSVSVKNENGYDVLGKELSYFLSEEDQEILAVTQNGYNFTLQAIGHGTANLRINLGEIYKEVTVNCVKAPEAITLPETLQTKNNIDFATGKDQEIANFNVNVIGSNVCQEVVYSFEKWNGSSWVVDSTAGTYSEGKLKFTEEGKFRVVATSNSGSISEKSATMEFNVNDGKNVSTFEELQSALKTSTGKAINIVNMQSNKLIPAFITAGNQNPQSILDVKTEITSGNLKLFGNGYEVDLSELNKETTKDDDLGTFISIKGTANAGNTVADHTVVIKDFTIKGNANINDENLNGKYFRAIEIGGDGDEVSYLVDINNVKVSQFGVGIRVSHAVSYSDNVSALTNVTVQNTWSNGLETAACQIILDSITIGNCGGCGMEVTPDSFEKAGLNFDSNQDVKFIGSWDASNLNNGQTPYFVSVDLQGITVPMLINASIDGVSNEIKSNVVSAEGKLNMIALVFNNVKGFPTIVPNESTVTQGAFASSIINFKDLTDIDTTHKYIRVDLSYEAFNLGSVILYNFNYQG